MKFARKFNKPTAMKRVSWRGFTIVELTVVIIVIGILASIVIVGYGSWRSNLASNEVKNDLTAASAAMESARNFGSGYPTAIPTSFSSSANTVISYSSGDAKRFCLDGRSKISNDIAFFIDSNGDRAAVAGTCAGGAGSLPGETIFVYDTTMSGCTNPTAQLPITSPSSAPGSSIDWGDGTVEPLTSALPSHNYATSGEKIIRYKGPIATINTSSITATSLRACLKEVRQWSNSISPTAVAFANSQNLQNVAKPPKSVTNMSQMFSATSSFNQDISGWDTSSVTNMSGMFSGSTYNRDISTWDTSNVTNMSDMFSNTFVFNQNISSWDTSRVTNMSGMFRGTGFFNQNISSWNTSNVTDMSEMFRGAASFNQPIGTWNTGKVTDMRNMFYNTNVFNQPLGSWNTSNVRYMNSMFANSMFNQPINSWNTANVTNMREMFYGAKAFNQPLGSWNTAKVTDMSSMFRAGGTQNVFNQNISGWNTSSVTDISYMFNGATTFNQNISTWNTSKVTNMNFMFAYSSYFNQNLSSWNVSQVVPKPPISFDLAASGWTLARPSW